MIISKDINNLRIKHANIFAKYQVVTSSGEVLGEFNRWEEAVKFCENQKQGVS